MSPRLLLLFAPGIAFAIESLLCLCVCNYLSGMNEGWDYWLLAPVICGGSSGVLGILWGIPLYLSKGDRAVFTAVIAPIVLFAFVGAWSGYAYHFGKGPANLRSSEEVLAESIFNCVFAQGFFAVPAGFVFGMVTLAFRARGSERDRLKG